MDDGIQTTKQQDYKEALINAKLRAIERAGLEITSYTKVQDFKIKFDMIESKANALLLPGFQVIDMGYQIDGTYQVVLSGQVQTKPEGLGHKKLRLVKSLAQRNKWDRASREIDDIINTSEGDDLVAEALYCKTIWGLGTRIQEEFFDRQYWNIDIAFDRYDAYEKLRAYYPDSKFVELTENTLRHILVVNRKPEKPAYYTFYKIEAHGSYPDTTGAVRKLRFVIVYGGNDEAKCHLILDDERVWSFPVEESRQAQRAFRKELSEKGHLVFNPAGLKITIGTNPADGGSHTLSHYSIVIERENSEDPPEAYRIFNHD
jgi:hypothetical protein